MNFDFSRARPMADQDREVGRMQQRSAFGDMLCPMKVTLESGAASLHKAAAANSPAMPANANQSFTVLLTFVRPPFAVDLETR